MSGIVRFFLCFGAAAAFAAVALGAFGTHALKARIDPQMLSAYQTAVQYQFWHALGLIAVGVLLITLPPSAPLRWSGALMAVGIVLFSGSLYVLALTGIRGFGAITPLGGIAWLCAWALLFWAVLRT
jgi:uncharacterized membrane protein YgdD (TMEM256/DUF423 family)